MDRRWLRFLSLNEIEIAKQHSRNNTLCALQSEFKGYQAKDAKYAKLWVPLSVAPLFVAAALITTLSISSTLSGLVMLAGFCSPIGIVLMAKAERRRFFASALSVQLRQHALREKIVAPQDESDSEYLRTLTE